MLLLVVSGGGGVCGGSSSRFASLLMLSVALVVSLVVTPQPVNGISCGDYYNNCPSSCPTGRGYCNRLTWQCVCQSGNGGTGGGGGGWNWNPDGRDQQGGIPCGAYNYCVYKCPSRRGYCNRAVGRCVCDSNNNSNQPFYWNQQQQQQQTFVQCGDYMNTCVNDCPTRKGHCDTMTWKCQCENYSFGK